MKRVYQPSKRRRKRKFGFRSRSKKIIKARRKKNRWVLVSA